MRKLAIGRIIGLMIAVVAIGGAIFFGVLADHEVVVFNELVTARPMEATVDLSQAGSISVPFHQTCSTSHPDVIMMDCNIKDEQGNTPDGLMQDLSVSISITDVEGAEVFNKEISDINETFDDGQFWLTDLPHVKKGNYKATIRITEGVPALAGMPQTIYAKCQWCSYEEMSIIMLRILSYVAGFIGLISMLIVIPRLIRFGFWYTIPIEN